MKQMKPGSAALLVILAATLARLVLAAGMGLGIDESYMVAAAHTFQRSIADQARTIRIPVHMIETINKLVRTSRVRPARGPCAGR